tara:strand:- start:1031 stop:1279 length:249 start_codon:yes stop_codon:yes gene_type:complete
MKAKIHNIIGPYNGPYVKNLMTYKLRLSDGSLIAWHEDGDRGFIKDVSVGDVIQGLMLDKNQLRPNYKKSKISLRSRQLILF